MNATITNAKKHFQTTYAQLQVLQEQITQLNFNGLSEKITFFKETYLPLLVEAKLAHSIWQFELHFPLGSTEDKKKYIKRVLQYLHQFFHQHQHQFIYFRNDDTHLEADLYTVGSPDLEIYSKVITALYFEEYLSKRVENTGGRPINTTATTLMWTEKQVSFVELVHSLHEAKAFNNGDVTLSSLTTNFGREFSSQTYPRS